MGIKFRLSDNDVALGTEITVKIHGFVGMSCILLQNEFELSGDVSECLNVKCKL